MDTYKILMELNDIADYDDTICFSLNSTGFVESLSLLMDGQELNLYNSEDESCETKGDLISTLSRNIKKLDKS